MVDLAVTVAPAAEPVSLAEAKAHLRVLHSSEDTLIARLVSAAVSHVERVTGRALVTRTIELRLPAFPDDDPILLPRPPLIAVASVTYVDTAGATQTLSSDKYTVTIDAEGYGAIVLDPDEAWPDTDETPRAVRVTYTAGYGAAADVPRDIASAILLHVGSLYAVREAVAAAGQVVPLAYESLLDPYRTHGWI